MNLSPPGPKFVTIVSRSVLETLFSPNASREDIVFLTWELNTSFTRDIKLLFGIIVGYPMILFENPFKVHYYNMKLI